MTFEKFYIPIAILVAGILMAGALYAADHSAKVTPLSGSSNTTASVLQAGEMRPVTASDHILGNPNADVLIVEYSDTECPFCKDFFSTIQQIMNTYGKSGQVAWVYRHFPIHSRAPKEAEATECANELGGSDAFWKYLTTLYSQTNSNDTFDPAQLPVIAQHIGLDVGDFSSCLQSGKYAGVVQADYDDAVKAGGVGTPFTILVTKDGSKLPINGEEDYATLKSTIDLLLGSSTGSQ